MLLADGQEAVAIVATMTLLGTCPIKHSTAPCAHTEPVTVELNCRAELS